MSITVIGNKDFGISKECGFTKKCLTCRYLGFALGLIGEKEAHLFGPVCEGLGFLRPIVPEEVVPDSCPVFDPMIGDTHSAFVFDFNDLISGPLTDPISVNTVSRQQAIDTMIFLLNDRGDENGSR